MYALIGTLCCLNLLQGIDKLGNWPKLLGNFRNTLAKAKKRVPVLETLSQDFNPTMRLLRLIARNKNAKSYTCIEANFLFAAMHIAFMKDTRFPKNTCPDLPDNIYTFLDE